MRVSRIGDVNVRAVSRTAFDVLHNIQRHPPNEQVAGIAWLFLLACKNYNLDPRRVLEYTDNILRRALDVEPDYPRAVIQYMRNEWPR